MRRSNTSVITLKKKKRSTDKAIFFTKLIIFYKRKTERKAAAETATETIATTDWLLKKTRRISVCRSGTTSRLKIFHCNHSKKKM